MGMIAELDDGTDIPGKSLANEMYRDIELVDCRIAAAVVDAQYDNGNLQSAPNSRDEQFPEQISRTKIIKRVYGEQDAFIQWNKPSSTRES